MNPQQLFATHKVAILGGGAAIIAALGLYQRKKNAAASTTTTTAGATIPGTIPAAAVVGGTGSSTATYDSTAFDIYDALQQQISDLASQQQTSSPSSGASATPGPIASSLFAPTGQGPLVRYGTGIYEVEADNSLYKESLPEWQAAGAPSNYVQLGTALPAGVTAYTGAGNLQSRITSGVKNPTTP